MAIKGAFQAGLFEAVGTGLEQGIKERTEKIQDLINSQMDTVRRTAPKLAQSMADAKEAEMMMKEMKAEFGVTDEEFIALAQNYDINQVYNAVAKVQASLPQGQKLDKQKFLGSLNIREGAKLPDNMTAEQALESVYLGYARNVTQNPEDTSDIHKDRSWGKAIKDTLMLDPRASAEEQLSAMSYMGYSVDDILQYQASMGTKFQPLAGVSREKAFSIATTDYDAARDYESSLNTFDRVFSRTVGLDPEMPPDIREEVLKQSGYGPDDKVLAAKNTRLGATAMAELEMELGYSGLFDESYMRTPLLTKLSNAIDNKQEMEAFIEAQKNGRAKKLILESIQKEGALTDEYIDAILTGSEVKKGGEPEGREPGGGESGGETLEGLDSLNATSSLSPPSLDSKKDSPVSTGDLDVDAILSNAVKEDDTPQIVKTSERAKAQRRIDKSEAYREAASKVTYEEYKGMSDAEKEAAELPTVAVEAGEAFGLLNPKKHFKGGAEDIDVDTSEDAEIEDYAKAAVKVSLELEDEFPDMELLRGEGGEELIKEWMRQNNIEINDIVLSMIKMQLDLNKDKKDVN